MMLCTGAYLHGGLLVLLQILPRGALTVSSKHTVRQNETVYSGYLVQ